VLISKRGRVQPNHALAGRAGLRDGQQRELLLEGWVGGVRHPLDLPEGYHTPARGRAGRRTLRFRRGLPPARRMVGLCQVDGMPHGPQRARSVSDHVEPMIIWTLYGHKTHPDNPRGPQTTSVCSREIRR
jgi:hypothetical protein